MTPGNRREYTHVCCVVLINRNQVKRRLTVKREKLEKGKGFPLLIAKGYRRVADE